jgi:glycosyltransferase involved in cell wall biosynthesis
MRKSNYILWLPSWYPNKFEPYLGDFIQRHAQATSLFGLITLIHFTQPGEDVNQRETHEIITTSNQLKEIVSYLEFKPSGIKVLDKIRYNIKFYSHAKKYLTAYFKEFGLPRLVHVHVPMKAGNLALWIKKKYGIDFIVSEHSSYYLKEAPDNYYNRHFLYRQQVRTIFKNAIKVTNVSKSIGIIIANLFQLKEVVTIHNVVNTDYFSFSESKNDLFTYVHVSTLSDQKNISGILRAFGKLNLIRQDWKLILVGPHSQNLIKQVSDLHIQDRVEFAGEVQYNKVADFLKKSHVKVLFSKHENFPCTIIEALCCGLPVVTTNIAGIKEAVDNSNGILIPPNDENILLSSLIAIRTNYLNYDFERISQSAIVKYSYSVIGKQIFNLYSSRSLS